MEPPGGTQPGPAGPPTGPYGAGGPPTGPYGQPGQPVPPPYQGAPTPAYGPGDPTIYSPIPGAPPAPPTQAGGQGNFPPGGPGSGGFGFQPPPRKRSTLAVVLIVTAVLAVLAVIAAIAVIASVRGSDAPTDPGSRPPGGPASTAPPAAPALASDAVLSYLRALEAGDADTALALTEAPPQERTLLTSDALSAAPARVRSIDVPSVTDPDAKSVEATYQVGSKKVTETFGVVRIGDQWRVQQTFGALVVRQRGQAAYPIRVNGVPVTSSQVNAFPAAYSITTGSRYVSFGKAVVAVRKPTDPPVAITVKPRLTRAGSARMISATRTALNKCLKTRSLAPKGCPFAATAAGYTITRSTLRWQLTNQPFDNAKVRLIPGRRYGVTTNLSLRIDGSVRCRNETFNGTCTVSLTRRVTALSQLSGGTMRIVWQQR